MGTNSSVSTRPPLTDGETVEIAPIEVSDLVTE
jgi:hypothetical protein